MEEPFPTGRPGAVHLDSSGNSWTLFEGVPPAKGTLQVNRRVTVGILSCEMDGAQRLHCSAGINGFDISGSDAEISLDGVVVADAPKRSGTAVPTATSEITENDASADDPVAGGT